MKNILTALLFVLVCSTATAQESVQVGTESIDSFQVFMSKKTQVSFLQQKNGAACETNCFNLFVSCIGANPTNQSVCYFRINQCLNRCNI